MDKKGQILLIGFMIFAIIAVVVVGGVLIIEHNKNKLVPNNNPIFDNSNPIDNAANTNTPIVSNPIQTIPEIVCVSNWTCNSWNSCRNKVKERTCRDLNGCLIPTNKPNLTMACSQGGSSHYEEPVTPVVPEVVDTFGQLVMTHKNLTDWLPYGENLTVNYTITGKTFQVLGVPENYTAIYYPDIGTYDNYTGFVIVPSNVTSNLPISEDLNGNISFSDYCTNGFNIEANFTGKCLGAKLWLVPTTDLDENGTLTWTNPNDYYFETNLIQYTKI
jgi:hypothetical protein